MHTMLTMDLTQRVRDVEALLRAREFDRALALTAEVETALAQIMGNGKGRSHEAYAMRERLESIRWAAQVGHRLTALAHAPERATVAFARGGFPLR